MDGTDGHAARQPLRDSDAVRDRIADEFARIVGHSDGGTAAVPGDADRADIDVATYLLHPPDSPELVERRARRQRMIGISSVVACLVLGVVLVVPWPTDDRRPRPGDEAAHEPARRVHSSAPARALPQRLDVPSARRVDATRIDQPPSRSRRVDGPLRSRATTRTTSARRSAVAAPSRPTAPIAPADAPVPLVPLS